MTPLEEQINAFREMSLVYIEQSTSADELHSVGCEMASIMAEIGIKADSVSDIKVVYLKKRRSLSGTDS